MKPVRQKEPRLRLDHHKYEVLRNDVLQRDGWRRQNCGSSKNLHVHHLRPRSKLGHDAAHNLITLRIACHGQQHGTPF
jgi:5-methylcytosine-specific restriction endonuclease McrA